MTRIFWNARCLAFTYHFWFVPLQCMPHLSKILEPLSPKGPLKQFAASFPHPFWDSFWSVFRPWFESRDSVSVNDWYPGPICFNCISNCGMLWGHNFFESCVFSSIQKRSTCDGMCDGHAFRRRLLDGHWGIPGGCFEKPCNWANWSFFGIKLTKSKNEFGHLVDFKNAFERQQIISMNMAWWCVALVPCLQHATSAGWSSIISHYHLRVSATIGVYNADLFFLHPCSPDVPATLR